MPNWCFNQLIITGPVDDIKKFMSDTKHPTNENVLLSFNTLVPEPKDIKAKDPRILSEDSRFWRIDNWGTKWDLDEEIVISINEFKDINHMQVTYEFHTAWTPCNKWLMKVSTMYPTLEFDLEFEEECMDIEGRIIVINGVVVN